jgi:hypothetical protein
MFHPFGPSLVLSDKFLPISAILFLFLPFFVWACRRINRESVLGAPGKNEKFSHRLPFSSSHRLPHQRREMRWFYVVEHEGLPYVGFGFGLFEFGDFGDDLVALVVAVRAGGGDSGQLREELDEAAMAREERLVDGGDHVFCWRFPPVALAVMVVAFPTVSDGDFVGVLLEIFTIFWVLLQRERERED